MIFDYNGNHYKCVWRTLMDKNSWYNMQPAKINVTIPISLYKKIMKEIKKEFGKDVWKAMQPELEQRFREQHPQRAVIENGVRIK